MARSPIVIDASIAVRWLLPDQLSEACWHLLARVVEDESQITVPALWAYEISSSLTKAVHFKAIDSQDAMRGLQQINALGVDLVVSDAEQNQRAFEWTLQFGRASAYDSYYLALAERLNCELWTADRRFYHVGHDQSFAWIHFVGED